MFRVLSQALLSTSMAVAASAAMPAEVPSNHALVRLLAGPAVGDSTRDRWLGLEFRLAPGWHVYWRNPGDAGSPPAATWVLPDAWRLGELQWPRPTRIEVPPLTAFGYENHVVFPIRFHTATAAGQVDRGVVRGHVSWVACQVECISEEDSVTLPFAPTDSALAIDRALVASAVRQLALPIPASWRLSASSAGTAIIVELRGVQIDTSARADFFPADPGVIEHSAKVEAAALPAEVTLRLTRSRYASRPPATLRGLVTIHDGPASSVIRSYEIDVPIDERGVAHATRLGPFTLLAFALLGGLLVNVMPCVFPLLAIKALSLTGDARGERAPRAAAYLAGSIASSAVIGGLLLVARGQAGPTWGFQMQSPRFLGLIAVAAFVGALNLLGVFELSSVWPSWINARSRHIGANAGAFGTGAAAILVGASCTAPFLGAALTTILVVPPALGLAAFVLFGIGAAAPLVGLALYPPLLGRLPRPGRWMETTKQLLAFPLLATTAWLVWVAQIQAGSTGVAVLLTALLIVALAAWILGRWRTPTTHTTIRSTALVAFVGMSMIAVQRVASLTVAPRQDVEASTGIQWQRYNDARLDSLRSTGRPVLVDFTAAWCLTCKVNEIGALSADRVTSLLRARSVGLLRADLTVADTAITRALHAVGAASVPTYAVYSPGARGEVRLLPPLLTPNTIIDAIERAIASPAAALLEFPNETSSHP